MTTTHTYDALVVGAGGAGMRAAIELSDKVRTAVVSKLYPTRSHTGAAQGGVCAALGNVEEDSPEWHAFDTVKGGDYLTDQPAAQMMTEEAVEAIYQLERWGLPFNRTPEGRIDQRRFGGHTANHGERPVKRACYAADRTGHMIRSRSGTSRSRGSCRCRASGARSCTSLRTARRSAPSTRRRCSSSTSTRHASPCSPCR